MASRPSPLPVDRQARAPSDADGQQSQPYRLKVFGLKIGQVAPRDLTQAPGHNGRCIGLVSAIEHWVMRDAVMQERGRQAAPGPIPWRPLPLPASNVPSKARNRPYIEDSGRDADRVGICVLLQCHRLLSNLPTGFY